MTDTTQHDQHGQGEQSQEPGAAAAELASTGPATATVRLPFGSLTLSLPQVKARVAGQQTGVGQGSAGVERLALYGGAALLGALEVLEWPVVLAAAGGTYALSRLAGRSGPGAGTGHAPHAGHDHTHGTECGHAVIPHRDHSDYLHDGHRHAAHDDHWDEH